MIHARRAAAGYNSAPASRTAQNRALLFAVRCISAAAQPARIRCIVTKSTKVMYLCATLPHAKNTRYAHLHVFTDDPEPFVRIYPSPTPAFLKARFSRSGRPKAGPYRTRSPFSVPESVSASLSTRGDHHAFHTVFSLISVIVLERYSGISGNHRGTTMCAGVLPNKASAQRTPPPARLRAPCARAIVKPNVARPENQHLLPTIQPSMLT